VAEPVEARVGEKDFLKEKKNFLNHPIIFNEVKNLCALKT